MVLVNESLIIEIEDNREEGKEKDRKLELEFVDTNVNFYLEGELIGAISTEETYEIIKSLNAIMKFRENIEG
jgi:hypothetical protein